MSESDGRRPARVLIVDDEISTRLLVREVLEPAGFEVHEAPDGEAGLAEFAALRPDLLLLDVVMPGMSGFDVLDRLGAEQQPSRCPVVMITGLDDRGAIDTAYDRGASDFITKPINWALLRQRVRYLVRAARAGGGGGRAAELLETLERAVEAGAWSWDPATGNVDCSDGVRRLLALDEAGRLPGRAVLARIARDDRPRVLEELRGAARSGAGFRVDLRIGDGDTTRIVEIVVDCHDESSARAPVVQGSAQDVTRRRRTEELLRRDRDAAREALAEIHAVSERVGPSADVGDRS